MITYDMGGTSTDVCLVKDGRFAMTTEGRVGTLPNRVRQIEINSIGAGGGSIAWLGAGRFLDVGPQSAGAQPGPACYGRGGTAPTVTDANVVLGRLGTAAPLGGEIRLDASRAHAAVATLAGELRVDPARMAEGIVRLAVVKMTGAIKEISIMRGHDPREFALFAYGGAGPLHAALIADELGMHQSLVASRSGSMSPGACLADSGRSQHAPSGRSIFDTRRADRLPQGLNDEAAALGVAHHPSDPVRSLRRVDVQCRLGVNLF
jgi:N-methylhydantoinase A